MSSTKLPPDVRSYLARSYPKNHNYRIVRGRLVPSWHLWSRYRRIRALYPEGTSSLVDLASCKGWFCLHAAQALGAERVTGIELHQPDLVASRGARDHLGLDHVRIEDMRLHQLHAQIADFGGLFDVSLVINVYHYLFFGSRRSDEHYGSHAEIFEMLHGVTRRALVLSNCTELDQMPRHMQAMAHEQGRADQYTTAAIRDAASAWFHITEHGILGKRPLWRLVPREDLR